MGQGVSIPEGLMFFTLHIQHNIHDVLQHLGASYVPRFGHMSHQENGNVMLLGNVQQCSCTFPDLQTMCHEHVTMPRKIQMHKMQVKVVSQASFRL